MEKYCQSNSTNCGITFGVNDISNCILNNRQLLFEREVKEMNSQTEGIYLCYRFNHKLIIELIIKVKETDIIYIRLVS